ncbi:MAG: flagellar biosynthetic protein FliR [Verrucomicrobiales bacterium]|nr:flagellar biosynthetic protein FliR [Verrucomicrobiales bacterium]
MNEALLANWWMIFVRIGGLMTLFPVYSAPVVSPRVRVALAVLMAFFLAPSIPDVPLSGWRIPDLVLTTLQEMSVGLLLGFICRMLFFALEIAGSIITTEIGLSLPPSFNPLTSSQSTIPGVLLNYLATVIWLCLDMHHWLLVGIHRTYALVPVGEAHPSEMLMKGVMAWMGWLFLGALQIAAPVLALSFILSLVFAVLGRAVPQMNVFSGSFAIRILAGLMLFAAATQVMGLNIANHLRRLPEDLLRLAQVLGS